MKESALKVVRHLNEAGHVAYLAGGCVRDMIRGVDPQDYDIATSATPEQVQESFQKTIPIGAQFGVILVLAEGHQFEVTTFRNDEAYIDGRHPTCVHYSSPEDDAHRRDFTINGLFYDPISHEIIDFVDGQKDIEQKIVRTIGAPQARFAEDKLRMLRAVRFAANLDYQLDPSTFAAVCEMAGEIRVVSAERIRDELIKIFTGLHAGNGLQLLHDSALLLEVLPEVTELLGVEQPPEFHPEGDVFRHTKMMLNMLPPAPSTVLAFSVLLHDIGKPATFQKAPDRIRFNNHDRVGVEISEKLLRRLRFSNNEIAQILVCVGEHMRFQHVREMRPAKLKRILARETFADELELHRIDCLSSHGNLDNYHFLKHKAVEIPPEDLRPTPLITGKDLLALGYHPGPAIGQVLRDVEELQLEDRLQSQEAALQFAQNQLDSVDSLDEKT